MCRENILTGHKDNLSRHEQDKRKTPPRHINSLAEPLSQSQTVPKRDVLLGWRLRGGFTEFLVWKFS